MNRCDVPAPYAPVPPFPVPREEYRNNTSNLRHKKYPVPDSRITPRGITYDFVPVLSPH